MIAGTPKSLMTLFTLSFLLMACDSKSTGNARNGEVDKLRDLWQREAGNERNRSGWSRGSQALGKEIAGLRMDEVKVVAQSLCASPEASYDNLFMDAIVMKLAERLADQEISEELRCVIARHPVSSIGGLPLEYWIASKMGRDGMLMLDEIRRASNGERRLRLNRMLANAFGQARAQEDELDRLLEKEMDAFRRRDAGALTVNKNYPSMLERQILIPEGAARATVFEGGEP
jgi:hypothetical protein